MNAAGDDIEDARAKRQMKGPANGRTRPTNNQLLYKAYFRWDHYPHKLREQGESTPHLPAETEACASVTTAFLQVLSTLNNVENARAERRNILSILAANTRRTKVVELSSGTHRVPDELKRHCLLDENNLQYSTNLDRNRYGNDDQYLSTVIRFDLDFLHLCPCLVDVEIIDAKNGSGTILVSAGDDNCKCNHDSREGEDKAKSWVQWGGIPSHQRNGVPVPERSNGHGTARGGGGGSQQSEAAASHRSLPDSSVPLVSPNGKTNSAFDMLLLALEKSENEQQGGIGGMEDDGHYFSRATSGEGAVTSRRVPSRSRIHTGSIGDDPSFQNALDALRDGQDELGSDGGLMESPFQRLDTPSRLPRAKHATPRKPYHAPPLGTGGNGGMLAGARLPMKQRKPAHSSANKLGGHQSSGLGRGGETSGISMSVDSGEGESLGDKVSPSGGRCHSSDRQREDLGLEAEGEVELDNVVTGKYQTVRTVCRQNSYANLQSNERDPHVNVRRLQEEVKMLKEQKMKMEQELEEAKTKTMEALQKAEEASVQARTTQDEIFKQMRMVQELQEESSSLASEKEAAMLRGSSHEALLRQLQHTATALSSVKDHPELHHLQTRLQEALKRAETLEEENRKMRQQLEAGSGIVAGGVGRLSPKEDLEAAMAKRHEGGPSPRQALPPIPSPIKAEAGAQSPGIPINPGLRKRLYDPSCSPSMEAKRRDTGGVMDKIHMEPHGPHMAEAARTEGDSLQSSSTGDSGNRALMLAGPPLPVPPPLSTTSRCDPRS